MMEEGSTPLAISNRAATINGDDDVQRVSPSKVARHLRAFFVGVTTTRIGAIDAVGRIGLFVAGSFRPE
jgi:hypothetical protein